MSSRPNGQKWYRNADPIHKTPHLSHDVIWAVIPDRKRAQRLGKTTWEDNSPRPFLALVTPGPTAFLRLTDPIPKRSNGPGPVAYPLVAILRMIGSRSGHGFIAVLLDLKVGKLQPLLRMFGRLVPLMALSSSLSMVKESDKPRYLKYHVFTLISPDQGSFKSGSTPIPVESTRLNIQTRYWFLGPYAILCEVVSTPVMPSTSPRST